MEYFSCASSFRISPPFLAKSCSHVDALETLTNAPMAVDFLLSGEPGVSACGNLSIFLRFSFLDGRLVGVVEARLDFSSVSGRSR